jgi:hypothetical protein
MLSVGSLAGPQSFDLVSLSLNQIQHLLDHQHLTACRLTLIDWLLG